jgi:hypothetical protein
MKGLSFGSLTQISTQKPLQKKWFNEGLSLPEILKFLWSGFGHSRLTIKAVQNIRGPKNLSILGSDFYVMYFAEGILVFFKTPYESSLLG